MALIGFFIAPSFIWLLLFAIPLGLGGGAVDAALNHFIATHYKAHHMNWLHCFWGIGAMIGPLIMSGVIRNNDSWRNGYLIVGIVQSMLVVLLFAARPLWRLAGDMQGKAETAAANAVAVEATATTESLENGPRAGGAIDNQSPLRKIRSGLIPVLGTFLFYCGTESTMGLWGSSFLVKAKGLSVPQAAFWVSMFYASITLGRFLSGFVSMKLRNVTIIRMGVVLVVLGGILLIMPLPATITALGFLLVGLGCAPIYPSMLHETPRRFGAVAAASLMGIQMAVAYTGSTFLPPLFGLVAGETHLWLFPFVILGFGLMMLLGTESANRIFTK